MSSWLRTVVTCLVVAAVPLQGVAAATMLRCGPDRHAATQASHHDHHHEMASADASHGVRAPTPVEKSRCSVCASCCAATALPAPIQAFGPAATIESLAPAPAPVAPVFLTSGPERPPRPTTP